MGLGRSWRLPRSLRPLLAFILYLTSLCTTPVYAQGSIDAENVFLGTSGGTICRIRTGSGTPESAVTGSVCDTYVRTDTGDLYTKQSGTATTTGWTILPRLAAANVWTAPQSITVTSGGNVLTMTGLNSATAIFSIDADGRSQVRVRGEQGAGAFGGGYMIADGYEESFFSAYTRSNTAGQRNMRWGNKGNLFVVQLLNDTPDAIVSTPLKIANTAPTDAFWMQTGGDVGFGADPGATPGQPHHLVVYDSSNTERGILVQNAGNGAATGSLVRLTTGADSGVLIRFPSTHAALASRLMLIQEGNFPIYLRSNNIDGLGILGTGVVTIPTSLGIGTTTTSAPLTIHSPTFSTAEIFTHHNTTDWQAPAFTLYRSRGTEAAPVAVSDLDTLGYITIAGYNSGSSAYLNAFQILTKATGDWTAAGTATSTTWFLVSNGTTGMSIGSAGDVGIKGGANADYALYVSGASRSVYHHSLSNVLSGDILAFGNPRLVGEVNTGGVPLVAGIQYGGTAQAGWFTGFKTRSASDNSADTIVQDDDGIVRLEGWGADGAAYRSAGYIELQIDGTPGASDMPGRWIFAVTPDASATPAERMRITDAGVTALALYPTAPQLTPGSGTGVTVTNTGEVRRTVYTVTVDRTQFIAAATTADVTLATLPAKARLVGLVADLTTTFACTATCTTATLSLTVGSAAGGAQYLASVDADAAVARFGLLDADLGTALVRAAAIQGGDLPSWTGTTPVSLRLTSGTGNLGTGAATNLSQGSITLYLTVEVYP